MANPIRVLHFADSHIGVENYGRTDPETGLSARVVDFLRRMDDICAYAAESDADLIVFAGDAFKTRSPNPTYQREFAHRIRDLAQQAPVVLLVGNHDVPPARMKASTIEIYDTLAVPNVYVGDEYDVQVIETKRGAVVVGTAPYPIRSRILDNTPTMGLTIAETDAILQEQLVKILDDMAEEADRHDLPRILAGHFTIGGAVIGSERSIMLGRDISVPLTAVMDSRWDYVAMGHIHKHQNLSGKRRDAPPVVYSGSIERIDFGEEGDTKGFCWIDLVRGETNWRFEKLNARPFVTLKADLKTDQNPTQTVVKMIDNHDLKRAIVRVILELSPESEAGLNDAAVFDALRRAQVFFIAAVRKDVEQGARTRMGGSPEGMTPEELFERYLISREIPEARRNELLEAAQSIFDEALE